MSFLSFLLSASSVCRQPVPAQAFSFCSSLYYNISSLLCKKFISVNFPLSRQEKQSGPPIRLKDFTESRLKRLLFPSEAARTGATCF